MARLELEAAPAVALPRRFLETAPLWGLCAGVLLLLDDGGWALSRWHPATLAATHAFTLGLLGNLLFGSLLQFLPAAVGVRLRGLAWGRTLHALLNLGAALLVAGLYASRATWTMPAAALLAGAFLLLAAMTLPGLLAAHGQRLLRGGLVLGLLGALVATACGVGLAAALAGHVAPYWPLPALVDVHAAWGAIGWMLLTLASVGRVVVPMFQGTAAPPPWLHSAWIVAVAGGLALASLEQLFGGNSAPLRRLVLFALPSFALAVLWLQVRTRRPRNAPLRAFWRAGAIAACLSALAVGFGEAELAGVLGLAVALPLFACGMQLEIAAFLGWIDLHRRCGRGVHLPGVQRLLPDAAKWRVLAVLLLVALLLPIAVRWPSPRLARAAALSLFVAQAWIAWTLSGIRRRAARFLSSAGR